MEPMKGKSVLLCVTGSIAAYKSAELVRLFQKAGARVRVAMTPSAARFVSPLTFEALSGHPVFLDLFETASGPVDRYGPQKGSEGNGGIRHIEASKDPDIIVVAPATANTIAKIAHGLGDDIVTTSVLASASPVVIAPAMNQRMWKNRTVQANVARLRELGHRLLGPGTGDLACGEVGVGRMLEPHEIVHGVVRAVSGVAPVRLEGRKILVTLGRTEEGIDPVRYITNRSSGKMGVAIAGAARDAGAEVSVIAGPTSVHLPDGVAVVRIRKAEEMKDALLQQFDKCDALVMVAAVADYRPSTEKLHKMESGQQRTSIDLEPTEDILGLLKSRRKKQIVIGFALETQQDEQRAMQKLKAKGCDLVIANNPLKEGAEFGADTNLVTFVHGSGQMQRLPVMSKDRLAMEILRQVDHLLAHPSGDRPPRVAEGDAARPGAGAAAGPGAGAGAAPGSGVGPRPRSRPRGGRRRSQRKKPSTEVTA